MTRAATSLARSAAVTIDRAPLVASVEDYVRSHPQASGYHLPAWLDVVGRAFGHETRYLAAWAGGELVGVLPLVFFKSRLFGRFAVSMPFVNYGGVLADSSEAAASLLDAAIAETERAGGAHLELRHVTRMFADLPSKTHKVAMILRLEAARGQVAAASGEVLAANVEVLAANGEVLAANGEVLRADGEVLRADGEVFQRLERQWSALDRKLRNQVRKAEKAGVEVTSGGAELLDSFYSVFARNMRDLGTPVYPRRFFREVLAAFPDQTRVFCARLGQLPLAASIVFWHGATIDVPWASSIRPFNSLCGNVLLYWRMVQFAIERGLTRFDFGRSTPLEGTYEFKRQWGAEPLPLVWEYWTANHRPLPDLSPKNPRFGRAISLWRRLPVAATRIVGPWIVRNIP